jgi:transposase
MGVAIGIDSHKRTLGAGATDELGREIAAKEFANDPQGHRALLAWTRARGADRVIGIEGSGSYGAGVARFLLQAGEDVREVPAFVAYREHKKSLQGEVRSRGRDRDRPRDGSRRRVVLAAPKRGAARFQALGRPSLPARSRPNQDHQPNPQGSGHLSVNPDKPGRR